MLKYIALGLLVDMCVSGHTEERENREYLKFLHFVLELHQTWTKKSD